MQYLCRGSIARKSETITYNLLFNIMETISLGIGSRIQHPEWGPGVVTQVKTDSYLITFIEHGAREISKSYGKLEVIEALEPDTDLVSFEQIEQHLVKVLRQFSDIQETVSLSDKWKGGRLVLYPGQNDLKPYEMPIATFFHKITMVRDRLRVMEQKVNASQLDEQDKIELQQYITRIYGSLTSFNILFKNRAQDFTGMRKLDE